MMRFDDNGVAKVLSSQVMLTGILVLSLLAVGCVPMGISYPARTDRNFTMFGRYEVEMGMTEWQDGKFGINCDVFFLTAVPVGSTCDSLPVLIMDSLRITDGCLAAPLSTPLVAKLSQGWFGENLRESFQVENCEDLWKRNNVILPSGFYNPQDPILPRGCSRAAYTVKLFVRLIDRKTHLVIAREEMSVRYIPTQ